MPFIRKVRVLCKTRLIFPRINGPNETLLKNRGVNSEIRLKGTLLRNKNNSNNNNNDNNNNFRELS